jgi:hypothetical protein
VSAPRNVEEISSDRIQAYPIQNEQAAVMQPIGAFTPINKVNDSNSFLNLSSARQTLDLNYGQEK